MVENRLVLGDQPFSMFSVMYTKVSIERHGIFKMRGSMWYVISFTENKLGCRLSYSSGIAAVNDVVRVGGSMPAGPSSLRASQPLIPAEKRRR